MTRGLAGLSTMRFKPWTASFSRGVLEHCFLRNIADALARFGRAYGVLRRLCEAHGSFGGVRSINSGAGSHSLYCKRWP